MGRLVWTTRLVPAWARRSTRVVILAGAAALLTAVILPTTAALTSSQGPYGCASGRPGAVTGPNGAPITGSKVPTPMPCITYNFADFGESPVLQAPNGNVMSGSPYQTNPDGGGPDSANGGGQAAGIALTTDLGSHWQLITTPPSQSFAPGSGPSDPQLWIDPITNRIYYTTIGETWPSGLVCLTDLSYSDNNGVTWTTPQQTASSWSPEPYGCPAFDFPHLWTAPPTTDKGKMHGYPDVVYICKSNHVEPARQCWKSLDGGLTFTEIGGSPQGDTAGTMGAWTSDLKGNIYGVANSDLNISSNEGVTWTSLPVPTAFGSSDPAVDSAGNIYLSTIVNNIPEVIYSKNGGKTWSAPIGMVMPKLVNVYKMAMAVGKPGQVSVSYIGNNGTTAPTPQLPVYAGGATHGYLTMTQNIFSSGPVFQSVQADPNSDPLLPNGWNPEGSTVTYSRSDFIGVTVGPTGQPWAYFYKDLCTNPDVPVTCGSSNPSSVQFGNEVTNWMGAVATMVPESS